MRGPLVEPTCWRQIGPVHGGPRAKSDLYALWYAEAARSRAAWVELSADGGLDHDVPDVDPAWSRNRRRVLVDPLEEYLRHTDHADLLREAVDGLRGNDPN